MAFSLCLLLLRLGRTVEEPFDQTCSQIRDLQYRFSAIWEIATSCTRQSLVKHSGPNLTSVSDVKWPARLPPYWIAKRHFMRRAAFMSTQVHFPREVLPLTISHISSYYDRVIVALLFPPIFPPVCIPFCVDTLACRVFVRHRYTS